MKTDFREATRAVRLDIDESLSLRILNRHPAAAWSFPLSRRASQMSRLANINLCGMPGHEGNFIIRRSIGSNGEPRRAESLPREGETLGT